MLSLEILSLSIKRLQYRNYRALDARLAPLGISLVQWGALREIERNPGLCMHRLAELTFNSDQAFGTLMTRLLRQKLVERQPGAGRANVHRLTPRGKTLLGEGRKRVRQVLTRIYAALDSDECVRLQGLLTKVLGSEDPHAAPRPSQMAHQPLTGFVNTLAGIMPGPGHAAIRASARPRPKKALRPAPSTRIRKTNPTSVE